MRSPRSIFIAGNKGGVGKTTLARLFAESHREAHTGAILVDGDSTVGQLIKHLGERDADGRIVVAQSLEHGVQSLDWHNDIRSRDLIAEYLESKRNLLIDLPGGSLSSFRRLADDTDLLATIRDAGYSATIVCVITPYVETWNDARDVQAWLPDIDVLAVANEGFGDVEDFKGWRASRTRANLLSGRGQEIILPRLEPRIAAQIARYRLRFHEAITSELIPVLDRGRAKRWLDRAHVAVMEAAELLGLPRVKA